ncbi:MAG: thiamine phosphate synthase [Magnetococcales bacterium]|nr:thiamine phosphate synthase [Magnetococcales bacterium]
MPASPPRLLLITDSPVPPDLDRIIPHALTGGGFDLLLRDKTSTDAQLEPQARRVLATLHAAGGRLLLHDRLEMALRIDADGLHLPEHGMKTALARSFLGADRLLGRSCHSVESAQKHLLDGGDYVTLSPVFVTMSHPDATPLGLELFARMRAAIPGPVLALGGIEVENARSVWRAGAAGLALIRGVFQATDPADAVRKLLIIEPTR